MKDNILLFNPPIFYRNGIPHCLDISVPPLGLLYLASVLNNNTDNLNALFIDVGVQRLTLADTIGLISKKNPLCIGITGMTPQLQGCLELAKTIRSYFPRLPIFLGGHHVSSDTDFIYRHNKIFDYAIIGEGERTFLNSIIKLSKGYAIPRIQAGEVIADLDSIPFPDRNLLKRKRYSQYESIIFSRGCPYNCYYCSRPAISKKVRYRSVQNLLSEIIQLEKFHIKKVDFQDDTLTLNRERVLKLCKEIQRLSLRFEWRCNTRIDLVDKELLYNMKKAGCSLIHFGIESGSERIRKDVVKKKFTNEETYKIFKICKKYGLQIACYFMLGHPQETRRDLEQTERMILNADINLLGISIPTPFPGSELYKIAEKDGIISKEIIDKFARKGLGEGYAGNYPVYIDKSLPKEEVFELRKRTIRRFYLRPRILLNHIKENIFSFSFSKLKKEIVDGLSVILYGSSQRQPYLYKNDKIAIVTPFFPPNIGGLESHLKNYVDFLSNKNIHAVVLTYRPLTTPIKHWQRYEKKGTVEIYRFWWWGANINLFEKFANHPLLESIYMIPILLLNSLFYAFKNRKKIKCFHAHGLIAASVVRIVTLFIKKRKIVSTHFIYNLKNRPFFSKLFLWILKPFNRVLTIGEASKMDLLSVGYPEDRLEIYRYSIDNENAFVMKDKKSLRIKYNFNEKDFIVLFVGRLLEMKGIKKLVEVASSNLDIKFVFVGIGELELYLKESMNKLPNIFYCGKKVDNELVEIYNISDIVVLPSDEEATPMVIIEALSCGKPVIVTNKGCAKEMFPNRLGRKIEPTLDNINYAIHDLQRENLEELSKECRVFALEHYNQRNLQQILNYCL